MAGGWRRDRADQRNQNMPTQSGTGSSSSSLDQMPTLRLSPPSNSIPPPVPAPPHPSECRFPPPPYNYNPHHHQIDPRHHHNSPPVDSSATAQLHRPSSHHRQETHTSLGEAMVRHPASYEAVAATPLAAVSYAEAALVPHPVHANNQLQLQHRPAPEVNPVSDIRDAHMTEAKARKHLSSYTVMRMEKSPDQYEVDEEGHQLPPTWQIVTRVEETDISQQEASRKVRQLNRDTSPVRDKKGKLGLVVQRQLEKAQQDLARAEPDPRYQYVLAQLESRVKEIEDGSPLLYKNNSNNEFKTRSRSSSRSKRPLERVSVTAYFQRLPKERESALGMLEEKKQIKQWQQSQPEAWSQPETWTQPEPWTQPESWSQSPQPRHSAPSLMPLPASQAQPAVAPPQRPQVQRRPTDICISRKYSHKGQGRLKSAAEIEVLNPKGPEIKVYLGSPRDSRASLNSDDMYDSDVYSDGLYSEYMHSEYETPESSNGSSSRPSQRERGRGPAPQPRERRQYLSAEKPKRPVASLAVGPPSPSPPLASGVEMDMLQLAYEEGRSKGAKEKAVRPKLVRNYRSLAPDEARRRIFGDRIDSFQHGLHRRREDGEFWDSEEERRRGRRAPPPDDDENLCYGDKEAFFENPFTIMGKRQPSRVRRPL